MERYTFIDKNGFYIDGASGEVRRNMRSRFYGKAIDRLAAYEDTGLEPREVSAAMKDGTYAQFQEWNRAHYEGRLLVLPTVKTNADKIRQMSNEELAEWLVSHDMKCFDDGHLSKDGYVDWLKQEVESDG